MTRQAYIDRKHKFLIFWSPKCGCSSIVEWWFAGPVGKLPEELNVTRMNYRRWLRKKGYQISFDDVLEQNLQGYRKIAIARDPFERAVSAYIDKFVGRNGDWISSFDMLKKFAAQVWCEFKNINFDQASKLYDGISFIEFLQYVVKSIENRGADEPKLNAHWNTQAPFAFESMSIYDEVYDLSEMDAALRRLNGQFGFDAPILHIRRTRYSVDSGLVLADMSSLEICRRQLPLNRESFRTAETEALVRRAYDIDYRIFGYR